MSEMLLLTCAVLAGVDWRVIAIVAVAFVFPVWALAGVVVHVARARPRASAASATFCQTVARELRSGSNLREAVGAGAAASGMGEIAGAVDRGGILVDVSHSLSEALPDIGREVVSLLTAAATSGASAAGLFDELGDLAIANTQMTEEVRIASAPARASAGVLLGLPLAYLAYMTQTGRLGALFDRGASRMLAFGGLALLVVGLVVGAWLIRRSR